MSAMVEYRGLLDATLPSMPKSPNQIRENAQACAETANKMKDFASRCFAWSPAAFVPGFFAGLLITFLCPHFAIGAAIATVAAFALGGIAWGGAHLASAALYGVAHLVERYYQQKV